MAAADEDGKRQVWGPRAVGALLPSLIRPAFRRRSPAGAQILMDWPAIVGPALAAVTAPKRLSGSSLTIACAGPMALELQHMTNELAARINGHFGRLVVERLRFVQEAVATPSSTAPKAATPLPVLEGVPAGALHDALQRLGQAVQGRQRGD